jgi:arsenate reductase
MRERGVDISGHRSKDLSVFEGEEFDVLVTTCDEANEACPYFAGARERLHWSLPDPAKATGTDEEVRRAFRDVADELTRRIEGLLRGWDSD